MGRQGHRNVVWHRHILYFDILVYSQPSKAVPPYFSTATKKPPYLAVPGTAEDGTAIFQYRQKNTAEKTKYREPPKKYRHFAVPPKKYRHIRVVPGTAKKIPPLCSTAKKVPPHSGGTGNRQRRTAGKRNTANRQKNTATLQYRPAWIRLKN